VIIPFVDVLHRVSLRIITMPIQSQGIITRDGTVALRRKASSPPPKAAKRTQQAPGES
jgi:hypothetical protein